MLSRKSQAGSAGSGKQKTTSCRATSRYAQSSDKASINPNFPRGQSCPGAWRGNQPATKQKLSAANNIIDSALAPFCLTNV